jgi:hypothetical protein
MAKIFTLTIIAFLLTSCGVSLEEYEASKAEAAHLKHQADSLQSVINQLQKTPATLISEAELQFKTGEYADAQLTLGRITKINVSSKQKKNAAILLSKVNIKLENIAYQKVFSSKDPEAVNGFIRKYPNSRYVKRVNNKVKTITTSVTGTTSKSSNNKQEKSSNGYTDISNELNYSDKASNNWNTNSSNESAKSYNKTTTYTTRISAICSDGTRSYATGRGTCSHHGGVSEWLYE